MHFASIITTGIRGASAIRIKARIYACGKCPKINTPLGAGLYFQNCNTGP